MKKGFDLVGTASASGIFEVEHKPAAISVKELETSRKFMKPALLSKVLQTTVDADHIELWEKTCTVAESPLLDGPYEPTAVDSMFPSGWTPVQRFGVRQSSGEGTLKLRAIDDYSECKVNQAFGYAGKIDLQLWTSWCGS